MAENRANHQAQLLTTERSHGQVLTGSVANNSKMARDVRDVSTVSQMATDVIDSFDAAANTITAAAHVALQGDRIRFTSGAASGLEVSVYEVATNIITLAEEPGVAPSATDTFAILRSTSLTVSATGEISVAVALDPIEYNLDTGGGPVATTVLEDTGTPADSRPLPVRLFNSVGDQLGTAVDPVRTDTTGTTIQPISASALPLPADAATETTLATVKTDTGVIATDTTSIDGKTPALGSATGANSVPVVIASDQGNVPVSQATHDSLNLNANLQVNDVDVSTTNPVFTDRLNVVDVLDTPLLDATTLNGSGGALVDVVVSAAAAIKKVQLISTAGVFIGLFDNTVLVAQFGPGSDDTVEVSIASTSVIALRSLETAAPAEGSIVVNFMG